MNLNVKEMPSIKSLINHIKTLRNNLLPLYTKMSFAIELLYMIIIASVPTLYYNYKDVARLKEPLKI